MARRLGQIAFALFTILPSCESGDEIGNCEGKYAHASYCWERLTRDACDSVGGDFTSKQCSELGYGCGEGQQWEAPERCIERCEGANLHLTECGVDARFDCTASAALALDPCMSGCAAVSACEALGLDPFAACSSKCAERDAG